MKAYMRIALAAIVVAAAACTDDPVAPKVEHTDEPAPAIMAAQQQPVDDVTDHFRARLDIEFEVDGELSPGTPITVHIEGTAVEDITSAEVSVALPTFHIIENGVDPGGKAPAVKSWTVGKLERGQMWKQSVQIDPIKEKGYYQITVAVTAIGEDKIPHVFDEVLHQRWMFVVDGGGFLTRVFDKDVFPDRIVPQPGPFEAKITGTAGDVNGDEVAARMAGSSSTIRIYAWTQNRYGNAIAMEGAEIRAEYIERGQWVTTIVRTVPSNGWVTLPCPGYAEQHISGRIKNPTTAEINGGHQLAYFQVRYSSCSGVKSVEGSKHLYLPWSYLDDSIWRIEDHFGYDRSRVTFVYEDFDEDDDDPPSTVYKKSKDKIIYRNYYEIPWVSAHEFAHALHHEELGGIWDTSNCNPHYVEEASSYTCALSEGFADYAANVGSPDNRPWGSWEDAYWPAPYHRGNGEVEGNVAALFHDLIDDENESGDETELDPNDVATVFRTCRNSRGRINDVADFVWCLENRVDSDVHEIRFPGLSVPSSPSSVRPSGWDADDIRSTWTNTVG